MQFTLNKAGVDATIRQGSVVAFLNGVADRVVNGVESNAPKHTGAFAGSITKTAPKPDPKGLRVRVYSTDWAAHLVEYGSANNPAYSPFRRAASSLGLRLLGGGTRP